MTNAKAIHTHVRLLAINDLNLQMITKMVADKRAAAPVEERASKTPRTSE